MPQDPSGPPYRVFWRKLFGQFFVETRTHAVSLTNHGAKIWADRAPVAHPDELALWSAVFIAFACEFYSPTDPTPQLSIFIDAAGLADEAFRLMRDEIGAEPTRA